MADSWSRMTAADVHAGDRVRLESGTELTVSRVEPNFLGMGAMVAFVEDTSERWFKQPVPATSEVEVQRPV